MLKFLKNWKFVFIITILLFYLLYFGTVYKVELQLPSEGWSRDLFLTQYGVSEIKDLVSNDNIFSMPVPHENNFITFWYEDSSVKYSIVDDNGTIILNDKLDFNIGSLKKIRGLLKDNIITLYSLEDKKLNKYDFNFKTNQIVSSQTIAQSVNDFLVTEDLLIYSSDNSFNLIDFSGDSHSIDDITAERFEIIQDEDPSLYHIALFEKTNKGENYLKYLTFNLDNKKLDINTVTTVASSGRQYLSRIDIGIVNNDINILASTTDSRSGQNTLYLFKFPKNDISNFSRTVVQLNGVKPDPKILKNERNELTFVASIITIKGKDTETFNIAKYTLDSSGKIKDEKLLTKTNSTSLNPYYFELNSHDYLVWTDIKGRSKRILLSSNNNGIISESENLRGSEIVDLFLGTLSSLVPSSLISLISITIVFVPTILIIFGISIVNIRAVESYSGKMFAIVLLIHSFLKILYSNIYILSNYQSFNFLPVFLENPISLCILSIVTTLISFYCLKLFLEDNKHRKHLVKSYTFLALIDLIIYGFLTAPYMFLPAYYL